MSVSLLSLCFPRVAVSAQDDSPQAAPADALTAAVRPYIERQELAGAVMLVAAPDRILCHTAVGLADIESRRPMKPDSVFWIASQSKPITAAAVMMLVEEGRLSVDDSVEKYLPEFTGQMVITEKSEEQIVLRKPNRPITVRDILTHTSGLPFRSAQEVPTLDRLTLADRVRSYAMTPLDFQPGTEYRYSNAGINTAARIIEVVTEQPFETFLHERLFGPLGMTDTTFHPTKDQVDRLAESCRPGEGNSGLVATTITQLHYPLTDTDHRFPVPAGGLFSTAADLARFYRMLANDGRLDGRQYLTEQSVRTMTSKQTPNSISQEYGFGFATGGRRFGHGGAYSTNSYFDREHGLIIIWLVQHAGFPGEGAKSQEAFRQAAISRFAQR